MRLLSRKPIKVFKQLEEIHNICKGTVKHIVSNSYNDGAIIITRVNSGYTVSFLHVKYLSFTIKKFDTKVYSEANPCYFIKVCRKQKDEETFWLSSTKLEVKDIGISEDNYDAIKITEDLDKILKYLVH